MRKKAQEEGITIFASLVVLMIVLVVFGILTLISSKEDLSVKVENSRVEASRMSVLNYLKTPISNTQTIQDLIIRWNYDSSLKEELKTRTTAIFDGMYGEDCYTFLIRNKNERILFDTGFHYQKELWVYQKIPLPEHGDYLTIAFNPTEFYEICNKKF